jgi:molybdopterin-guanine dinucleotide biosynthesis protein A
MGREKALLPFRGRVLVASVAQAVEEAAGTAVLVGNPALGGLTGYAAIPDLFPGEGPLGGILTALRHTLAEWNLITACDMPRLDAAFLSALLEAAETAGADVLLPHGPSGQPEPLCAVYRHSARGTLEAAFAAGVRKITAALAGLRAAPYEVSGIGPLENVNTPEDWCPYAAE